MKKLIILLLGLAFGAQANSQVMTHDAATSAAVMKSNTLAAKNVAKNASILSKAGETLTTLNKMREKYDEWSENIEMVSETIAYGKEAINISNLLGGIEDTYADALRLIRNSQYLSPTDRQRMIYVFAKILNDCVSITTDSVDILTSGKYKMNDADRLTFLKESENKLKKKMNMLRYMTKKVIYAETKTKTEEFNNSVMTSNTPTFKN